MHVMTVELRILRQFFVERDLGIAHFEQQSQMIMFLIKLVFKRLEFAFTVSFGQLFVGPELLNVSADQVYLVLASLNQLVHLFHRQNVILALMFLVVFTWEFERCFERTSLRLLF